MSTQTCEMAGFQYWWILNVQAPWGFSTFLLFLWKFARRSKRHLLSCLISQFNRIGVILLKLVIFYDLNLYAYCFPGNVTKNACWYLLMQIEYEGFRKAHNTIVAFYREYSKYCYLYFTIGKQWSKDVLNNKGISISQYTSIAKARGKCNDRNLCIMTLRG
jgi:hypothetical protein